MLLVQFYEHINVQSVVQLVLKVEIAILVRIHFVLFSSAHTIKYCQATGGDDHHHHRQLPTPYEKMLRMQTFDFDEQFQSSLLGQFSNPSSLYSNGWSDSYL